MPFETAPSSRRSTFWKHTDLRIDDWHREIVVGATITDTNNLESEQKRAKDNQDVPEVFTREREESRQCAQEK